MNFSLTLQSNPKLQGPSTPSTSTRGHRCATPGAVFDELTGQWVSNAEVAEASYTAFESTIHKVTARLVVRRVRELNPAPAGQDELFPM